MLKPGTVCLIVNRLPNALDIDLVKHLFGRVCQVKGPGYYERVPTCVPAIYYPVDIYPHNLNGILLQPLAPPPDELKDVPEKLETRTPQKVM